VLKPAGIKPHGAGLRHGQAHANGQRLNQSSRYTEAGAGRKEEALFP